jgi:cholesterol oxidase
MATAHEEHFDAVVVGSGFGGSVTAFRLAEAGMRVCLLERGKAYPPGSFPRSPWGTSRNLWDPSEGPPSCARTSTAEAGSTGP